MSKENRKFDSWAIWLYQRRFGNKPGFTPFSRMTPKEKDYWRGLAQIYIEESDA